MPTIFASAWAMKSKDRIKRQIAASVEASLTVASRELWQRMYEAVSHMADRLFSYKATEQGWSILSVDRDEPGELVDVIPRLNVTGDLELERSTEQVRASLLVDPAELRNRRGFAQRRRSRLPE